MAAMSAPTEQVVTAVREAARGRNLHIRAHAELRGASVTGTRVQAYVVPVRDGFRVELWYVAAARHDPYKTVPADDLAEAAGIAVDHALNRRHARA
jgi:hypothetical protein